MKKKEIKGLSAFELLEGLDDDMILSASLPEATPVATPTVGERIAAFFGRMGKGGMAAAITGIVVAVAVLIGVLLAGRMGGVTPTGPETNHGIQNGTEADPDTNGMGVIPPLTETPDQKKGEVAVVSDGITVYPNRYCVNISEMWRDENGELIVLDGDGPGAVYQLAEIWDELPIQRTAGNSYALNLPEYMTLRSVRIFETVNGIEGIFEELAIPGGAESAADVLKSVTSRKGEYVVVLEVYHETIYSADEYTKGVDEYAFRLTVDPSMNDNAPVRVIHGDKTYFPTGYLLEESYYDAELRQEVTKQYDGVTYQLQALLDDMVTVTLPYTGSITQEGALSLYLAPFYDLKEITVYDGDLNVLTKAQSAEPLEILCSWGAGDYYVIISAAFAGTGAASVTEFPLHVKIVEETSEETYPNDDGEIPEPPDDTQPPVPPPETHPRVIVSGGGQSAVFETEEDGFLAWTAYRLGAAVSWMPRVEGTPAADVIFTDDDAMRALPKMEIFYGDTLTLTLDAAGDDLIMVYLYDAKGGFITSGADLSVIEVLQNEGGDRHVVVILETVAVVSETETACYEYAFELDIIQP